MKGEVLCCWQSCLKRLHSALSIVENTSAPPLACCAGRGLSSGRLCTSGMPASRSTQNGLNSS